jgi:long-chain fatty acid transport protein
MGRKYGLVALAAACLVLAPSAAQGSGYNIYEQGAKASGQAVAFVARADDASAGFYNPAGLAALAPGWHVTVGFSVVMIGDTQLEIPALPPGVPYEPGRYDMEDNDGLPPHLYAIYRSPDAPWVVGFSLTAPFGLKTEWDESFGGRFSARTTDLEAPIFSVLGAWQFEGGFSIGAGVDYVDATLNDFARNIFLPGVSRGDLTPLTSPISPALGEPYVTLRGDGDDISWNVSARWESGAWRVGAVYRDGFEVDLEGNLLYSGVPSLDPMVPVWTDELTAAGVENPGPTAQALADAIEAQLMDEPASGTLNLPTTYAVGVAWVSEFGLEVELNYNHVQWSDFDELLISKATGDELVIEDWMDTDAWRLGGSYDLGENHELRAGVYTEDNPIPTERLRPSIPDAERFGYTLGYGYQRETWSIDAYWMHIEIDEREVPLSAFLNDPSVVPGMYESQIDLWGVTANFSF